MRKTLLFMVLMAAAACGGSGSTGSASPSASVPAATVAVAQNGKLGQILVDGNGRTLYLFEADKGTSSTCYSSCASYWPPLLTGGAPQAGTGATASLLGTTKRTDGTTASFLKELIRRSVLESLHDDPALTAVTGAHLARALDDLLDTAQAVTRTLLGVGVDPADLPVGGVLSPGPGRGWMAHGRRGMPRRFVQYGG